jgi:hypothetical protein
MGIFAQEPKRSPSPRRFLVQRMLAPRRCGSTVHVRFVCAFVITLSRHESPLSNFDKVILVEFFGTGFGVGRVYYGTHFLSLQRVRK